MVGKIANKLICILGFFSLYCRSLTWKRDDGIIIVGSWFGEKFADNSRYLYQYLFENKEQLGLKKVVWVTRKECIYKELVSMGYECYMMDSKESVYFHKHAGWHIICNYANSNREFKGDINGYYSFSAKRINLWHGVGFKGVYMASNEYKVQERNHSIWKFIKEKYGTSPLFMLLRGPWVNYYILCTTPLNRLVNKKSFNLNNKSYILSSYPRNCNTVRLLDREKKVISLIQDFQYTALYLPTFRTGDKQFDFTYYEKILNDTLINNNILLIQKAHSADTQNKVEIGLNGNVLNLPSDFDINVLLPYITVLITDYSSVMSDAMYHNKPVLYLVPDYEEYKNGDRGFVINPDEIMKGPIFKSIGELNEKLAYYCQNPDEAKFSGYEIAREKLWGNSNKELEEIWMDIVDHVNRYD